MTVGYKSGFVAGAEEKLSDRNRALTAYVHLFTYSSNIRVADWDLISVPERRGNVLRIYLRVTVRIDRFKQGHQLVFLPLVKHRFRHVHED